MKDIMTHTHNDTNNDTYNDTITHTKIFTRTQWNTLAQINKIKKKGTQTLYQTIESEGVTFDV